MIPGLGSFPEIGNGNLQYSCLGNPMDRGAWWAIYPWGCKELDMTERLTHTFETPVSYPSCEVPEVGNAILEFRMGGDRN